MEETHFFLVYGVEDVLLPEITMGSLHVQAYDKATWHQLRRDDDIIDE
jgi:hypothetical protein